MKHRSCISLHMQFQSSVYNFQKLNSIHKFPNSNLITLANISNLPCQRVKQVVVTLQFVHQASLFSAIQNNNNITQKSNLLKKIK